MGPNPNNDNNVKRNNANNNVKPNNANNVENINPTGIEGSFKKIILIRKT